MLNFWQYTFIYCYRFTSFVQCVAQIARSTDLMDIFDKLFCFCDRNKIYHYFEVFDDSVITYHENSGFLYVNCSIMGWFCDKKVLQFDSECRDPNRLPAKIDAIVIILIILYFLTSFRIQNWNRYKTMNERNSLRYIFMLPNNILWKNLEFCGISCCEYEGCGTILNIFQTTLQFSK